MFNPSLGWQKLQDVYYFLRPCYESLNWSITNLYQNNNVKISPQSTLLAITSKHVPHPTIIDIYSISGVKLCFFAYNSRPGDHIVDFAFKDEDLVVVLSSLKFRYYKDFQGNFNEYEFTSDLIHLADVNGNVDEDKHAEVEETEIHSIDEVLEVKVFGTFLVIKLETSFIITDLTNFKNYTIPFDKLFQSASSSSLHFFDILSLTQDSLTLLVSYDVSIFTIKMDLLVQEFEVTDEGLTEGPFDQISSSPNGMLVSLYNAKESKIFVINSKFDQVLLEYDTSNELYSPYQVGWCGNDAIILSLRDEIKLIGPGQKSISFYYDLDGDDDMFADGSKQQADDLGSITVPILKSEVDGLKIITSSKVEFISRVPETSLSLYQIGSSSPSSILLDCIDKLSQHSPKADTNISLLKSDNSLQLAMNECLQASLDEFQPFWQKKLLRAVSFGKVYIDDGSYDADEYLQIVSYLKVLNQIRSPDVGIFITYKELLQIGWSGIIDMLLKRNLHFLALKVIGLIKQDEFIEKVYIHWCCYKITKELNMSDVELFAIIAKKLKEYATSSQDQQHSRSQKQKIYKNLISVDEISEVSFQEGRIELCKLLINLEPSILKKINSFVILGDLELALIKSFQTGDFDLSTLILLQLQDSLSPVQFFKILNQNEQKGGGITDTSLNEISNYDDIKDFLHLSDDKNLFIHGDLISNFWIESIGKENNNLLKSYYDMEDKQFPAKEVLRKEENQEISKRRQLLTKFIHSSSTPKKDIPAYEYELHFLNLKSKLVETYQDESFLEEKSILSILTKLVLMNQIKAATKISREFKVSKEKFWWLALEVLTKAEKFDTLYQFITSSSSSPSSLSDLKSPIGFQAIVDRCFAFSAPASHLSVYIKNCTNIHYTEKIKLLIKNKDLLSAAAEAYRFKDVEFLHAIQEKANREGNAQVVNTIKTYISRLGY
ncbi:vacuolar protein sorting-associated protein 16 [[Candida] railenensis]|uniref:Probable vacuolar protein sorting-associated protein 16 homolog n=1 Tax=[Candida] railenensis TaxID=45579 RepID=A0A9P0W138_9ASCO|nr:vacuolar protein sorting-associated protein 16 [[Candida] railenensis]